MNNKRTFWTTLAGVFSSTLAFLGIVNCCGMPILAGILAALGIGASQPAFLAEYHWWFMGFAIISLLAGFYQTYFRAGNCCAGGDNKRCSATIQRVLLWLGAIMVVLLLFTSNGEETKAQDTYSPAQSQTKCCGE